MLSLFLSFPPPTPPPGGVCDFFTYSARRRLRFWGQGTGEGDALRGRARLFRPHPSLRATFPTRGKAWRTDIMVVPLADFALIRHWRATFPTRGKAFSGIPLLHGIPLNKRDPACWRPAWGGVRLRGNGWWVHMILGEWCRFAQDDTWGTGGVAPYMFGANVSTARPPSSVACGATFPLEGEGFFRRCVALCGAS